MKLILHCPSAKQNQQKKKNSRRRFDWFQVLDRASYNLNLKKGNVGDWINTPKYKKTTSGRQMVEAMPHNENVPGAPQVRAPLILGWFSLLLEMKVQISWVLAQMLESKVLWVSWLRSRCELVAR